MFEVNNKGTRNDVFQIYITYFTPCFSVFILNFEHVTAGWDT